MTARRVGQLLSLVVLLTSAVYMLVYLYRWEWNRALVSGLFFVATEVAIAATILLRRLRVIERKLDQAISRPSAEDAPALEHLRATAPARPNRFAWLEERAGSMNVFVPVLLGAGVVLSLLASVVERLAGATAMPALERRLADRLAPLAVHPGGLLGSPRPVMPANLGTRAHPSHFVGRIFVVAVIVFSGLVTVQAIDIVADATQTRADEVPSDVSTELTLHVRTKGRTAGVDATAEALWVACRNVLNRRVNATTPEVLAPNTYRFVLHPAIGSHARRRLEGCLEDATLDRTTGRVVSLLEIPKS